MHKRVKGFVGILLSISMLIIPLNIAQAKDSVIKGIDVSEYNGKIDWDLVASQDLNFVMIRTAQGRITDTYEKDLDKQFEENYEGAGEVGLNRGVYHVCCGKTVEQAKEEADYCLQILDGRELEYPVAYDVEKNGNFENGKENVTQMVIAFCEMIEEAGYTPMLYTTSKHLEEDFDLEALGDLKIWVAHHGVEEPKTTAKVDIWQYSATDDVPGANTSDGVCDVNYSFMEALSADINKETLTLGVGEKNTLSATLLPTDTTDTVTWSTEDKSIATINASGVVKAKGVGKTTITGTTFGGAECSCTVTVKKAPTKLMLGTSSLMLKKGASYTIKPSVSSKSACSTYTYKSSKSSIATINSKGVIKAKKAGTTTITVTTYNGIKKTMKVTVTK